MFAHSKTWWIVHVGRTVSRLPKFTCNVGWSRRHCTCKCCEVATNNISYDEMAWLAVLFSIHLTRISCDNYLNSSSICEAMHICARFWSDLGMTYLTRQGQQCLPGPLMKDCAMFAQSCLNNYCSPSPLRLIQCNFLEGCVPSLMVVRRASPQGCQRTGNSSRNSRQPEGANT